jgi:hypothetical protein
LLSVEGYQLDIVKFVTGECFADMDEPTALESWFRDFESMLMFTHEKYLNDAERVTIAYRVAIANGGNLWSDMQHWNNIDNATLLKIKQLAIGRKAFTTETGHAGLGPKSMKAGDAVCVVEANLPIILNKSKEDRHRYLGQAYLYDVMSRRIGMSIVDNLEQQTFKIE